MTDHRERRNSPEHCTMTQFKSFQSSQHNQIRIIELNRTKNSQRSLHRSCVYIIAALVTVCGSMLNILAHLLITAVRKAGASRRGNIWSCIQSSRQADRRDCRVEKDTPGAGRGGNTKHSHPRDLPAQGAFSRQCGQVSLCLEPYHMSLITNVAETECRLNCTWYVWSLPFQDQAHSNSLPGIETYTSKQIIKIIVITLPEVEWFSG